MMINDFILSKYQVSIIACMYLIISGLTLTIIIIIIIVVVVIR